MFLLLAFACSAPGGTLAHWTYTYAYSHNVEDERLFVRDRPHYGLTLYYERTGNGLQLHYWLPVDQIREVDTNETTTELQVQVWGILNTSVLVLHFDKSQREYSQQVIDEINCLPFAASADYLPMQKRAKIPPISSSVASSPVS
jgi:hypothetical protein